ncbi:MAG: hypothetical protein ACT6XS_01170 [Phreatobacter sp.]|uniref:hypothetical protein n=1 Tax=Phreatobacter sp. TaxID=1966341 RepID=UPI00403690B7
MTTDRGTAPARLTFARFARLAVVALAGWFVFVALLTLTLQPTSRVVVIGPSQARALEAVTAAGGEFVAGLGHGAIAEGAGRPGFVRDLYKAGAWLVLPATRGSCLR